MTAAAVPAGIVPPRPAWRSLLWLVPLTVLWIVLIYWQPIIPESGVQTTAHQLMAHALIAIGLWLGLESTDLTPGQRRTTWLAIMIPDTLWFAVAWSAAINGVFNTDASSLPLLPLAIFLPLIIGAPLLLLSKRVGQVLDTMPVTWLVALQLYRVFGSWALAAWLRGVLPGVFALPAGMGDVLTGLFAVPTAIALATGTAEGRRAAIIWNIFGLADFAVAIALGMITSPGRFQLIVPDVSSIGAGAYPTVLTPAFVVPSSILLHALSLRQLIRRRAGRRTIPTHLSLTPFDTQAQSAETNQDGMSQAGKRYGHRIQGAKSMTTITPPEKGQKEGQRAMNTPPIVSPQEWEAARQRMLVKEKAHMRAGDSLAAERRRMPWMAIEKAYKFDGPHGEVSLLDLFEGRRQLIVYRAFFEPGVFGWPEHACRGCSLGADQVGHLAHLNARDTTLAYASRAPQTDIVRLKARMSWEMPWYTITDSFDADFGVDEYHGHNAFIRDGDKVYRTYFINWRGDEAMGTVWSYLDMTALGRQEMWEDSPEGYPRTPPYKWWNWHDNYAAEATLDPKWAEVSDAGEGAFRRGDS